jgi:hypothetical protein
MSNRKRVEGEVAVDARGRLIGFNRVRGTVAYDRYRAVLDEDTGVVTLTPMISMTPAELADLQMAREKPHRNAGQLAAAAYDELTAGQR